MLYFTNHAKDRMKERWISKQEVEDCLENYQVNYPNDDSDVMNYVYTSPTGRRIRVVISEKRVGHRIVISVMD